MPPTGTPYARTALPTSLVDEADSLSLSQRMSQDIMRLGAEHRREQDAQSLGSMIQPDLGASITGTTGYESMLQPDEQPSPVNDATEGAVLNSTISERRSPMMSSEGRYSRGSALAMPEAPSLSPITPRRMAESQGQSLELPGTEQAAPVSFTAQPGGPAPSATGGPPSAAAMRSTGAPSAPEQLGPIEEGNPERYFATAGPYARQVERETGIPAALSLAISANETGYGQRRYMAGSNNFHGIQARAGEPGAVPYKDWRPGPGGQEFYDAAQRSFDSPLSGFRGFADFLTSNPRYQPALERYRQTGDVNELAAGIHRAGYAEDPQYTQKITSIMKGIPVSTGVGEVTDTRGVPLAGPGGPPTAGEPGGPPLAPGPVLPSPRAAGGSLDTAGITRAYQGVPYVFGGAGGRSDPTPGAATDCSGFVSSVWKNQYGLNLAAHTDTSYNQLKQLGATDVAEADARPGDVVYYLGAGTGGAITHHMGIYAGPGKVLDMSVSGGDGVKTRDIGHAGRHVILRDPRVNQEMPKQPLAPPPIVPSGDSGGQPISHADASALQLEALSFEPTAISGSDAGTAGGGGAVEPAAPPVRDSYRMETTQPYDPDQGPREALPGSVGAQPYLGPLSPNPEIVGAAPQISALPTSPPAPEQQRPPQYSGPSYAQPSLAPDEPSVPQRVSAYATPTETEVGAVQSAWQAAQAAEPVGPEILPEPVRRAAGAGLGALQTVQAASDAVKARIDPRVWGFAKDGIAREILSPDELARWTQLGSATYPDGTPKGYADYRREQAESQAFTDRVEARYQQIKDDPDALTRYANASPAYAATSTVTDVALAPAVGALASGAVRTGATALGAGARTARAAGYAADVAGQSLVDPTSLPLQPAADLAVAGVRGAGRVARGLAGAADAGRVAEAPGVQYLASGVVPEPEPARRFYHGTAEAFGRPDPAKFAPDGLFGPGYYLTSDPRVAGSYADARAAGGAGGRLSAISQRITEIDAELGGLRFSEPPDPPRMQALEGERAALEAEWRTTPGPSGQNVRAVDVPSGLRMLDADAPVTPDVLRTIQSTLDERQARALQRLVDSAEDRGYTFADLHSDLGTVLRGNGPRIDEKLEANRLFAAAGFDGMQHRGGKRVPMMDDAGKPIEHDVTIVFPESLDKIRNAFSGEAGGSGVIPSAARGLRADAFNAAQGGVMGAASEDLQAQQEGREADPAERARRALIGGTLGVAGGRYARRGPAAARALGSGLVPGGVPEPPRGPRGAPEPPGTARAPKLPEGALPIRLTEAEEVARLRTDLQGVPDDAKDLLEQAARDENWYHANRRGVLPDDVVARMADEAGRSVSETIRTGEVGRAWSAEETVALRNAVAGQTVRVNELGASVAASTSADAPGLIGEFTREAARLSDLMGIMEGARAEAGRSLRQWGLPSVAVDDPASFAQAVIKKFGGDEQRALGAITKYNQMIRDGATPAQLAGFWQQVMGDPIAPGEIWDLYRRFNMLSGPRTLEVNAIGGGLELAHDAAQRVGIRAVTGHPGEAAEIAAAPFIALGRAGRNFVETLKHGITVEQAARGDLPRAISARMDPGIARRIVQVMETPDRLNAATDQFIRTLAEQMIATDSALKQTRGLTGDARAGRMADLLKAPTREMAEEIKAGADRITFQGDLGRLGRALRGIQQVPIVGNLLIPFLTTVYHIGARGIDRSPLGILTTAQELARSGPGILGEIGQGAYRAGQPLPKGVPPLGQRIKDNAVGMALGVYAYNQATNGNVTGMGPDDPEKRAELMATGWRPYSVRFYSPISGKQEYWSYANLGPWAFPLAQAAAAYEAQKYAKDDASTAALLGDASKRFAMMVTESSVVSGIGALAKSLDDPDRYGSQWLTQFAQSLIPAGSLLNTVGQAMDPTMRRSERTDAGTQVVQGVEARIPPNPLTPDRLDVPAAQDPLGRDIANQQTGLAALHPFRPSAETGDPVIQEFIDARVDIGKPKDSLTLRQGAAMPMTPAEQRAWNTARGQAIQQIMGDVTRDAQYRSAPLGSKAAALRRVLTSAAAQADQQLITSLGEAEITRRMKRAAS